MNGLGKVSLEVNEMSKQKFDYIIIGAGSAGCVLANRLSADPSNSVLLIEAGGSDKNILIKMPTEPTLDGRKITCPRGKVMGGSSSINGMVYVRGHACDFDEWEELGAKGWGYQDCLPYFKRAETWHDGADEYRGGDGPLGTGGGNNRQNPLYNAFIKAGAQAGYGTTEDCNGERQEGFGAMHKSSIRRWFTSYCWKGKEPSVSCTNVKDQYNPFIAVAKLYCQQDQ